MDYGGADGWGLDKNRIKTVNALKLWLLLRNMDIANNVELHKRLSDT